MTDEQKLKEKEKLDTDLPYCENKLIIKHDLTRKYISCFKDVTILWECWNIYLIVLRKWYKVGVKLQLQCIIIGYCLFLTTFALIKTMGVFFIQLQTEFEASAAQISFTVGLPGAVVFMGGPAYGAIFNALGIRPTFTLAGCLMFAGFGSCFFTPTLYYTQLCMGVVAGIGAGLCNVATLTLMGRAFYTSRPVALGALAMGGSTATAIGGPVLQWCINRYTWRGAFVLLGAYTLHGIAFGFMISSVYEKIIKARERVILNRVIATDRKMEKDEYRPSLTHSVDYRVKETPHIVTPSCNRQESICRTECDHKEMLVKDEKEETGGQESKNAFVRMSRQRSSIHDRLSALSYNVFTVFDLTLLKKPWFLCYCLSCGFSICSRIISGLYLIRYAQAIGIGDYQAAKKLFVCETAAFLMIPFIALITSVKNKSRQTDESKVLFCLRRTVSSVRRSYVLSIFQIAMSVVILLSTFMETNNGFTVYAAMLGLCYGAVSPLPNVVLADLFGTKRLAGAVGYRSLATGILLLSVPLLVGHLIDEMNTYRVAQYFTSGMSLLSGLLTLLCQTAILRQEKRDSNNNS